MTQVIIVKSFRGKHGEFSPSPKLVNLPAGYADDCIRNGLAKLPEDEKKKPEPSRRQAMPGAPSQKKPGESNKPLGDGPEIAPLSSRAARAHAKKTSRLSIGGVSRN